ncbi:hypothetical protein WR25_21227 isoform E [Diploscapter pachys]|uniref:PABS domain-containing protein n=1 Tax=Diploscapter pachys TaxID=2018661 RepID=A0A2A2LSN4_9BILA|nr:hypothetical protein WR25_21227 isoform E [Diploscapter pachys]
MNQNLIPVCSTSTFSFLLELFRKIILDAKIAYYVLLRLSINSALTWNDLDSRKWEIRKEYIDLIYPVLMISNGFMTGTMKLLSKTTYNILLIGHGGGIISSFFSTLDYVKTNITSVEIDPLMAEFAKKWFGYRDSESQHLIIDDGLEYFKYAEKEGYKFDVIILDACPNQPDPQTGVFCPLKQMLDNPVLERMNKILAKNGTLIMNFIANMSPDLEKQVMKQVSDVFKDCYKEHLNTNEAMITCSNDMGNNPTDNEALFNDRYKKLRPYLNIVPFHAEKRYQESLPKELKSNRIPKVEDWARDEL